MKNILILFLILFSLHGTCYCQVSSSDSLYKRIPVVRYTSRDFLAIVNDAFIHSPEYLDICIKAKDTLFVQYRFGKSHVYRRKFFDINKIDTQLFFGEDSLFIVSIKNESLSWPDLPIYRIYGMKKCDGYLYGLTWGKRELYSFSDLLKTRYGSIDKFREIYLNDVRDNLSLMGDEYNGIALYPNDKRGMQSFLEKDYVIYERYNPTDTVGVLNRFVSLVSTYTLLKEKQKDLLENKIIERVRYNHTMNIEKKEIKHYIPSEIILYGADVTVLLSNVLTESQYEVVYSALQSCNSYRRDAIFGLHLFRSPKNIWDDGDYATSYEDRLKETANNLLNHVK